MQILVHPFNPISENTLIIQDYSALTKEQQLFSSQILNILLARAEIPLHFKKVQDINLDDSEKSNNLKTILDVARDIIPEKAKINKVKDVLLNKKIKSLIEKTKKMVKIFGEWKDELNESITVFEVTIPSNLESHSKKISKLGLGYQKFYAQLYSKQKELQLRIAAAVKPIQKISLASLELIKASHLIEATYINCQIEDYRKRTHEFIDLNAELAKKCIEIEPAVREFEKKFNWLDYLVVNKCLCNKINKSFYAMKFYNKLADFSSHDFKHKEKLTNKAKEVVFSELKQKQRIYISKIFEMIIGKYYFPSTYVPANLEYLSEKNSFLNEIGFFISSWTPCSNSIRIKQDNQLVEAIKKLTTYVTVRTTICSSANEGYDAYLIELEKGFLKKTPDLKKDSIEYKQQMDEPIRVMATTYKTLTEQIKKRITEDKKGTISQDAIETISLTFDITPKELEKNFESYHTHTKEIKDLYGKLSIAMQKMNEENIKFQKKYCYLAYLIKEQLLNTLTNMSWFESWYAVGYYNYFHDVALMASMDEIVNPEINIIN